MTHQYVIALGGRVLGSDSEGEPVATAIGWAAGGVLAVGSDTDVRSISRGDSTFIDVRGCIITQAPADPIEAQHAVQGVTGAGSELERLERTRKAGLLGEGGPLEPGSRADLAFWGVGSAPAGSSAPLRIVALVRAGAFTTGDPHCGPFPRLSG